ncbi:uncharacterized protein LOC117781937 isoform X2 [Drosophila innubila]|uniref:uncharacterized protein LOC117781937 isoform X2 n=1 Tax=Drosophila innubila TaxID=198719 RepID=UPI00148DB4A2|nr:uncharacterized protein LOC117781937 isoform X2 [Drosophila innubila]
MDLLNTSLTPVRLDSHHTQSPIKHNANLANCKARMESLVNDITSNYAKWKLAHQRGTSLCYAIEAKKTRCLEKADEESGYYPEDMISPCDKLAVITSIFVDIVKNTHEILRQMRALIKLAGPASNVIFYRTWKLQKFVSFTEELSNRYARESIVKQQVMQNIAHCTTRSKLIAYTTAWEFPDHVDAYVDLVFRLLAEEVKTK